MLRIALLLSLFSQLDHTTPSSRVIGILELPEIFGEFACDRYAAQPVEVRSQPSDDSSRLGVLELTKPWYLDASSPCEWIEVGFRNESTSDIGAVRFMEYTYEEPGLIVTESNGDWFRIELVSGFGWIRPQYPERFHSYEELVRESLAYLRSSWQGLLWESPGSGDPSEVSPAWRRHMDDELTVEVLEAQTVENQLWLKVRLDPEYGCGSLPDTPPTTEGWVPGYGENGENAVWFYSRGC